MSTQVITNQSLDDFLQPPTGLATGVIRPRSQRQKIINQKENPRKRVPGAPSQSFHPPVTSCGADDRALGLPHRAFPTLAKEPFHDGQVARCRRIGRPPGQDHFSCPCPVIGSQMRVEQMASPALLASSRAVSQEPVMMIGRL